MAVPLQDTLGRPVRDLRISVTDRCNFRCVYCMPKEVFGRDYRFLERRELLTFEEIERLARAFVAHGVEKIRITGGEPLVRRDVERLVALLASIPASVATRRSRSRRSSGSPPVILSFCTPRSTNTRATRSISSNVSSSRRGRNRCSRPKTSFGMQ